MILISHRGCIIGSNKEFENKPEFIKRALNLGYDVEIDLWKPQNKLYLGHDKPTYEVNIEWLNVFKDKLWIHCKNIGALYFMTRHQWLNYFWHQEDSFTLTSHGVIWAYPAKEIYKECINVLPELNDLKKESFNNCLGICSDYIERYK